MLAISGAHISYLILAISFLIKYSKISKRKGKVLSIFALIFFMFLIGFQVSVTRACLCAILIIVAQLLYKEPDTWCAISFSLLLLLIQNPFNINSLSLQLSFGGTIGILIFMKYFYKEGNSKIINTIKSIIIVSVCAQIIIFPIMLKNFGTVSFSFFISNLVASPLLAIIIILGFITVFISFISLKIAILISVILNLVLKLLIYISQICSSFPLSQIYMKIPHNSILICYYVILTLIVFFANISKIRKNRIIKKITLNKNKIISCILIVSVSCLFIQIIPKNLKIYFIDVGQRR